MVVFARNVQFASNRDSPSIPSLAVSELGPIMNGERFLYFYTATVLRRSAKRPQECKIIGQQKVYYDYL